ncbi:cral trio domain protein [Cystoisospora suis]|uniref:Cral trio domain protein n=1 Tax=Cystoisospora suis TaxID=483139 RepID=A0A2C6KAD8_9APIC|nr:cral trio domain protein [Cystoisospora suis]
MFRSLLSSDFVDVETTPGQALFPSLAFFSWLGKVPKRTETGEPSLFCTPRSNLVLPSPGRVISCLPASLREGEKKHVCVFRGRKKDRKLFPGNTSFSSAQGVRTVTSSISSMAFSRRYTYYTRRPLYGSDQTAPSGLPSPPSPHLFTNAVSPPTAVRRSGRVGARPFSFFLVLFACFPTIIQTRGGLLSEDAKTAYGAGQRGLRESALPDDMVETTDSLRYGKTLLFFSAQSDSRGVPPSASQYSKEHPEADNKVLPPSTPPLSPREIVDAGKKSNQRTAATGVLQGANKPPASSFPYSLETHGTLSAPFSFGEEKADIRTVLSSDQTSGVTRGGAGRRSTEKLYAEAVLSESGRQDDRDPVGYRVSTEAHSYHSKRRAAQVFSTEDGYQRTSPGVEEEAGAQENKKNRWTCRDWRAPPHPSLSGQSAEESLQVPANFEKTSALMPFSYYSIDKRGYYVMVTKFADFDAAEIRKRLTASDIRSFFRFKNLSWYGRLSPLPSMKTIVVADAANVNVPRALYHGGLSTAKTYIQAMTSTIPLIGVRVAEVHVVNVPAAGVILLSLIKALSPKDMEFFVHKTMKDFREYAVGHIGIDNLPEHFGGSNKCSMDDTDMERCFSQFCREAMMLQNGKGTANPSQQNLEEDHKERTKKRVSAVREESFDDLGD